LAKLVKSIGDKKPEQKYIFAFDQTVDKRMKNIISCISQGIGEGLTKSIPLEEIDEKNLSNSPQDFYIDPSRSDATKLNQCITDNELNWQHQLNIDLMLNNSKFIEEEFEWHSKEGIPANIKKLLEEFCKLRKLRPIKIILNSEDKNQRSLYAEKIAKFFNIPVINYDTIMDKLNLKEDELTEEQIFMNKKFLYLQKRLNSLDPNNPNETNELLMDPTEIMFETLKNILKENICVNRGYVLEGLPINMQEIDMLFYRREEIVDEDGNVEEEPEPENNEEEGNEIVKEKKKKIKKKKYNKIFEKEFLPESLISISKGKLN
jgi:hypothetical protein